jgi:hypothetical protein
MHQDGMDLQEQMRLDNLREQKLQELATDGNINSLNEDFAMIEQERRSFMIQDRPSLRAADRLHSAAPPQNRP